MSDAIPTPESLSDRERVVYQLAIQGYTSEQIGKAIHRSIKTVESHRCSIARKVGVPNTAALVWEHFTELVLPKQATRITALETALKGFVDGECHCETSIAPCVQCVASKALAGEAA